MIFVFIHTFGKLTLLQGRDHQRNKSQSIIECELILLIPFSVKDFQEAAVKIKVMLHIKLLIDD